MSNELDKQIQELSYFIADAEILAMNIMSPVCCRGCLKFELCTNCERKKYCLAFIAKKFLKEYKKKGIIV